MSSFEQLHPALQHHIVNSLGWRSLRPFQEAVIPRILSGEHLIVLAPTAGGKTEAALFPTLSRMLTSGWTGLSVLYICPIKALLNNLDVRLQRYCTLLGRRSAVWHGDIRPTARKRILRDPPDCLLTTPESLEVMLVSRNVDERGLFSNLQMVIIDEIHAFAGDDRGWHLLAVLERISRLAGRELQRIGLSATVGNPDVLVDWLAGSCAGPRGVYLPPDKGVGQADVKLDYVGSLHNAAVVISRLHRGEKRLVFVDSRARAEQLATDLRGLDVTTFVTHSSLSPDQRKQAEEAFASRDDCVIVATSVLELGIDVGDLDRVIQIDAPTTVSSFLQRMGRTGRRAGTLRNCLFLATREDALLQAAALIDLWSDGYVEPIVPPPRPLHILSQQLMALALQEGGIGRQDWFEHVAAVAGFASIPLEQRRQLLDGMLEREILWDDEGLLWLGRTGEETFGRRSFLELFSVFVSAPLFAVLHGRREVGYVDEMSFLGKQEGPRVLLLGGRAWQVNHIDWQRRIAYVEPTEEKGRSRWLGQGSGLGLRMCRSAQHVLAGEDHRECWSRRAREQIDALRTQYPWLQPEGTVVVGGADGVKWWTFAGSAGNATLANELASLLTSSVKSDSFSLEFDASLKLANVEAAISQLKEHSAADMRPAADESALDGLKFSECLPRELALEMLEQRMSDTDAVQCVLESKVRLVSV
ncbi:ATP-dependent RNA helicase RhlE [Maioricimonas rarisocia]|uniref:ATP-dependent RNA helicase RhlE n=1 Tax=Maioricimonas rarisocia TaxID=2528026 RepID=A0A517ZFK9_9PLAN|nr:DEAD/DEAH box helicase [Maioricimonas rarisocia]QDU41267.1 ATP-dependent RNA helicase RhlE [Maioricimonas rarisocia]